MKVLIVASWGSLLMSVTAFQVQCPSTATRRNIGAFSRVESTKLAAFVDISEDAPRDIETMEEWAASYGVQTAEGFQLTSENNRMSEDVSVVTNQDLAADTPVLFVPNEMILSSSLALQEFGRLDAAEELLDRLEASDHLSEFYLFLKILAEYELGDQSPYFPWLNSLPRWYSNGASMTPFCYECLPPLVAKLAMNERTKFIYFCQALKQVDFLSDETKGDKDLAKWAYQIVYTRSFEVDGDVRVVPMADMFNHGTETEVEISYDEDGNCYAYATKDVPAGSPLRMSYGDPTNPSQLFARYGFVDESSPATFCKIMITPTSQLVDMGYDYSRMLFYKDTGDVSEEVWDVLLYQNLADNRNAQQAFYEAHMSGDYETKQAIHDQYWPETSATLRNHVDTFLEKLDELSGKGVGKDIAKHPRLPLILEHNEFVKSTFLTVKANL